MAPLNRRLTKDISDMRMFFRSRNRDFYDCRIFIIANAFYGEKSLIGRKKIIVVLPTKSHKCRVASFVT